jgi:hypothetical protein
MAFRPEGFDSHNARPENRLSRKSVFDALAIDFCFCAADENLRQACRRSQ